MSHAGQLADQPSAPRRIAYRILAAHDGSDEVLWFLAAATPGLCVLARVIPTRHALRAEPAEALRMDKAGRGSGATTHPRLPLPD